MSRNLSAQIGTQAIAIDFVGGRMGHRLRDAGREVLLRAVGGRVNENPPTVVDATAGLGRDAFVLADAGLSVLLVERSRPVYEALIDGLERARATGGKFTAAANRMNVVFGDSRELLPRLAGDVVLVDPMHPERTKSALVKKDMRILRELVGEDPDAEQLIEIALQHAQRRVVLKWPLRHNLPTAIRQPDYEIKLKATRLCVFLR